MKLLIAGCGDLGTELGLRAVAEGHDVIGIRRNAHVLPSAFTPIAADLTRPLPALPTNVDAVVVATSADRRDIDAYRRAYIDAPRNLIDALEAAGAAPGTVVFTSSTGVYGVSDGSWVDEETPTEPTSATGEVLVHAEQAWWAWRGDAVVLRLGGVYGPGRTRLIDEVRAGEAVISDPPVHTNRIHRDDAAAALLHLLHIDAPRRCYLGVDDEPATRGEVLRFLADEIGADEPRSGTGSATRGGDKRCRNDRLEASGFCLTYPSFREGYRAILTGVGQRHP